MLSQEKKSKFNEGQARIEQLVQKMKKCKEDLDLLVSGQTASTFEQAICCYVLSEVHPPSSTLGSL